MKILIPLASNDNDFENRFQTIKHLCKVGENSMIENFITNFNFNYEYIFLCKCLLVYFCNILSNKILFKKLLEKLFLIWSG